jgi:hypothetical protein
MVTGRILDRLPDAYLVATGPDTTITVPYTDVIGIVPGMAAVAPTIVPAPSHTHFVLISSAGISIGTWGEAGSLSAGWGDGSTFVVLGAHVDLGDKTILAPRIGVRGIAADKGGAHVTWELAAGIGGIAEKDIERTNEYVWPHGRIALGIMTGAPGGTHFGIEASYAAGYAIETTASEHLYDYSGYWDMAEVAAVAAF